MPINVADLPWQALGLLAGLTFVASLIGHSLTRNAFAGAIITLVIFVAVYIGWNHYDHQLLPDIRFPNAYVPATSVPGTVPGTTLQ